MYMYIYVHLCTFSCVRNTVYAMLANSVCKFATPLIAPGHAVLHIVHIYMYIHCIIHVYMYVHMDVHTCAYIHVYIHFLYVYIENSCDVQFNLWSLVTIASITLCRIQEGHCWRRCWWCYDEVSSQGEAGASWGVLGH